MPEYSRIVHASYHADGMKVRRFNKSSPHPARAVQCWQILVGKAMNRQTVTYVELGKLMYRRHAAGVLNKLLGHVAFYCIDHGLPPLTSIVVNSKGIPGHGIPHSAKTLNALREKLYRYDWYDVYPPTEVELETAFSRH